jgi:hypothetical protein
METLEQVEVATSPFAGAYLISGEEAESERQDRWVEATTSPFAQGFTTEDETEAEQAQWAALVDELSDESFDEAVESLVDEVAGRHLQSMASWASNTEAAASASQEAAEWIAEVGASAERVLEQLEAQYADRPVESVTPQQLDEALTQFIAGPDPVATASEQFLGGLVKKAFKAAKRVAKAGLSVVGKLLPMGKLFGLLRRLVKPLLKRVLAKAINRLPASARGPATDLARKFGVAEAESGSEIAAEFDAQFAGLLIAPTDSAAEQLLAEAEAAAGAETLQEHDPLARLDTARATLTQQLAQAEPGKPPTEQLEQFIPAVMAALPLIRAGIKIVGRERVKNFLATALATLIQGYVGPVAAKALAPHIAHTGLRLLSLEAESSEMRGAEALVDTLEETITSVAQLPASSLDDPLRLESEIAEAFSEAAGRLLPREVLRPDLETFETEDQEAGEGWVRMPRRAAGCRRYRKFNRVYDVAISRPRARAIVLGEDTLEDRLLDAGVERWPVRAEAHIYEAMLGTHLGHLAAFEGEGAPADADEFEELTPARAAIMVGQPGLGRRVAGSRVVPGRRFFRLVVPGRVVRRRRSRIIIRLDATAAQPALRLHLRLGERSAHLLSGHLAKNALPDALGVIRRLVGPTTRQSVAVRLARHLAKATGAAVPTTRGDELAGQVIESMLAVLSEQLPTKAAEFAAAAKDPAPGLTLTFEFRFADKAALMTGKPEPPSLTIRPGQHRD